MKSIHQIILPLLLFTAACKKETSRYQQLNISGISSLAFTSGDAISIYGAGFDTIPDNNNVTFNGVAGEVATATPNRLQVIVPALINGGRITVQAHGQKAVSSQTYDIVNVLQGTYNDNLTLTADKKYLLRGNVVLKGKLIIEPGTVVYGEKLTHGSLAVSNINFQGTADKPIVFTSDQAPGTRQPGDWGGITATAILDRVTPNPIPVGMIQYLRVEFAGYHQPGTRGSALSLSMEPSSIYKFIQVSYSGGDGITFNNASNGKPGSYIEHIVAFGCGGDDFRFSSSLMIAQYGLAIKDPYYAEPQGGNGIVTTGACLLSNFTVIGYGPAVRNIINSASIPLTQDAGRGIKIGDQADGNDNFYLYNSVIAGGWTAGVSLWCGNPAVVRYATNWDNYENSPPSIYGFEILIRNNYFIGTAPAARPYRGGVFTRENYLGVIGYEDISGTPKFGLFGTYNDTTRHLDLTQGIDELGLQGIADYRQMGHPAVLPPSGSPLQHGARFPAGTPAFHPLLNKDITFVGAFGTQDWTIGWTNFNPQQTSY